MINNHMNHTCKSYWPLLNVADKLAWCMAFGGLPFGKTSPWNITFHILAIILQILLELMLSIGHANGQWGSEKNLDPAHHWMKQNCDVLEDERWQGSDSELSALVRSRTTQGQPWEAHLSTVTHRLHSRKLQCAAFSCQKLPWRIDLHHEVAH